MKLAQQIYQLRTQKNMSQNDLADLLEVSRQSVSKWETGASVPDLEKLSRMSEIFNVSLDILVNGTKDQSTQAANHENTYLQAVPCGTCTECRAKYPMRKIVGMILCFFGAAVLMLAGFAGSFSGGVLLSLPFFITGIICLAVRRPFLWCCWSILLLSYFVLPYAMGVCIGIVPLILQITESSVFSVQCLIGIVFLLLKYIVFALTVLRFYDRPFTHSRAKAAAAFFAVIALRILPHLLYTGALGPVSSFAATGTIFWNLANDLALMFFILYLVHSICCENHKKTDD